MVTIRRERPDDADAVAGVHVRAWQAGYAGIMPDEVLSRLNVAAWAQRRRQWRTADDDQPFTTYVAEADDGEAVGFATVGPYREGQDPDDLDPAYGEILAIYVDPACWGAGVGRELLAAARASLAEAGHDTARLWVLEDNARARRFYDRAGFAPDGERSTYTIQLAADRDPVALEEIRYVLRLDG
jgi:ribosomal protein S18 acetylase RimI-like enzyme